MQKRLILVAALPAAGKNYVADRLCAALGGACYIDKDDLAPLVLRGFSLAGEAADMDGRFYLENLRDAEYEVLMALALSALRYADTVLVNAPFLREVRDLCFMQGIKARAAALGARLSLVWVTASEKTRYARMKKRNAARDEKKLLHWAEYARSTDASVPEALLWADALDELILFDNENADAAEASLLRAIAVLEKGKNDG